MHSLSRLSICTYISVKSHGWIGHLIRSVNSDVTGPLWHHEQVVSYLVWNQSISDTMRLSYTTGCTRQGYQLSFYCEEFSVLMYFESYKFDLGQVLLASPRCYVWPCDNRTCQCQPGMNIRRDALCRTSASSGGKTHDALRRLSSQLYGESNVKLDCNCTGVWWCQILVYVRLTSSHTHTHACAHSMRVNNNATNCYSF